MSDPQRGLNRRQFIGTTSSFAMASILGTGSAYASGNRRFEAEDAVGKPVSDTDAATGGGTKVPAPPGRKIRYAIVGIGKLAAGQILPGFAHSKHSAVAGFVSGDAAKARAFADAYGVDHRHIYNYKNFDTLIDDPEIDAVFIILPNAMHAEYTVRAARAGKHVLCEKPMATNVADCQRMIEACRDANRKLMIAYRMRYEPFNKKMIEWSRQQKYGPIQMVLCDTLLDVGGANQWRLDPALSGGGSLVDIGIYSLNAARYLTGEEPTEINAMAERNSKDPRFSQIEQSIAFQLRFPSGAMANCSSSYGAGLVSRFRVVGTKGWYGLEPAQSYRGLQMNHSEGGAILPVPLTEINQFAAEMDHFSQCIINDKTPLTDGAEGLKDIALIEKIYAAAR